MPVDAVVHNVQTLTLDFGFVRVGTTASRGVSFTDRSSEPTVLQGLAFNQRPVAAGFTLDSHNRPAQLAAGASCSAVTRYSPTTLTAGSGTISFTTTAGVLSGTVNLPMPPGVDLSVSLTGLFAQGFVGDTGTLVAVVRNNAATSAGLPVVQFSPQVFSASGLSGLNFTCTGATGGAVCGANALPAGAQMTFSSPYTVSAQAGQTASITVEALQISLTTADPNLGNNRATQTMTGITEPPKRCVFNFGGDINVAQFGFQGTHFDGGQSIFSVYSALGALLFTGWDQFNDPVFWSGTSRTKLSTYAPAYTSERLRWTGSNAVVRKVTTPAPLGVNYPYFKARTGSRTDWNGAFNTPYIPVVQLLSNGRWVDASPAWWADSRGQVRYPVSPNPTALTYWTQPLLVKNSNNTWSYRWHRDPHMHVIMANNFVDSQPIFVTNGDANGFGRGYPTNMFSQVRASLTGTVLHGSSSARQTKPARQTWIEYSPGPNCQHPQATRIDLRQPRWDPAQDGTWGGALVHTPTCDTSGFCALSGARMVQF